MEYEFRVQKQRQQKRGETWSLERFMTVYGIEKAEAERLYARFGPSSVELALLMRAKGISPRPATATS